MNREIIISPSILSANASRIADEIALLRTSRAKFVHIDIMDGRFVPATTFSDEFVEKLVPICEGLVKDVHIMVEEPWINGPKFAKMGADYVTFHLEACPNEEVVRTTIRLIREAGSKVGISIKPATPVETLLPYLQDVDMILIMTVEPGKGGQAFMPECADKISYLANIENRSFLIECDGGIKDTTVQIVKEAGVDVIVAGSYLFGHDDFAERVETLL